MNVQDAVAAFRRSDMFVGLDVSSDELDSLMQGASRLAELFPGTDTANEQVYHVGDLDIRHVICARAVCAHDSGLNPDPELAVDARIQRRVIRRSNRLAGLPPDNTADDPRPTSADAGGLSSKRKRIDRTAGDTDVGSTKRKRVDAPGLTQTKRSQPFATIRPPAYTFEARLFAGRSEAKSDGSPATSATTDDISHNPFVSSAPEGSAPSEPVSDGIPAVSTALLDASRDEADGRPRRRVGKTRSRGNRRRRARPVSPPPSEDAATGPSALLANAAGAPPSVARASTDTGGIGLPAEFDFHFVDFQAADFVYRRPRTPLAVLPVPDILPAKPSHRSHSAEYYADRSQRYRASLSIEQLRPKTVSQEDGRPALAVETLNRTVPGWRGRVPRALIQRVSSVWGKPGLKDILGDLHMVPYTGKNTAVTDMNGRTVLLRTTPMKLQNGGDVVEDFATDAYKFARMCPIKAGDRSNNARGHHYACVAGHHRQYAKLPYETRFQRDYEKQIRWLFREDGPAACVTSYLSGIIQNRFPAMAERMQQNRELFRRDSRKQGRSADDSDGTLTEARGGGI